MQTKVKWACQYGLLVACLLSSIPAHAELRPCREGYSCKDVVVSGPGERALLYASEGDPLDPFSFADKLDEGQQQGGKDKDANGKDQWMVRLEIGTTEEEKRKKSLWSVVKDKPGGNWNSVRFTNIGDLTSLEPFVTPQFTTLDGSLSLLANMSLSSFLGGGNHQFSDGQVLDVTNGTILQSSFITFSDATSLLGGSTLPDTFSEQSVALLPLFTGQIVVTGPSRTFEEISVPEPGSISLFTSSLCVLMTIAQLRRRRFGASLGDRYQGGIGASGTDVANR